MTTYILSMAGFALQGRAEQSWKAENIYYMGYYRKYL